MRPSEDSPGRTVERTIAQLRRSVSQLREAHFVDTFLKDLKVSGFANTKANLRRFIVLGLGSPSNSIVSRLQLSLAIILVEHLGLTVSEMELYDPVFTPVDEKVIESLDKIFGAINAHTRQHDLSCQGTSKVQCAKSMLLTREAADKYAGPDAKPTDTPTFWFMPHCEAVLYENVLKANWAKANALRSHIFLGNNFQTYAERWAQRKRSLGCPLHVLSAANILRVCVKIHVEGNATSQELAAFGDTSVQIIGGDADIKLPAVPLSR